MTVRVADEDIQVAEAKVRELRLKQALDDLQEYGAFTRAEAEAVERWVLSQKRLPPDELMPLLSKLLDVESATRIVINSTARYYLQRNQGSVE